MSEVTMVGKTIAGVSYPDSTEHGFSLLFTDGTVLNISERMQAGAIVVTYEGQEVVNEREDFYD
jgi:hypothetical protein